MMVLLRMLGLRGVLLIALVAVVIGMAVRIDVVTGHRDLARADLATATRDLAIARSDATQAEARLRSVVAALETERELFERQRRRADTLRERITRETGTNRDGMTAPVLEDAIRGLEGISLRDGQSSTPDRDRALEGILTPVFVAPLSRIAVSWTITVVVAGRIEMVAPVSDGPMCREAAAAVIEEITGRPEFETRLKGRVLIVCSQGRRMDA